MTIFYLAVTALRNKPFTFVDIFYSIHDEQKNYFKTTNNKKLPDYESKSIFFAIAGNLYDVFCTLWQ
jgi:hypothetical protein